jgi:hypothetical protein
MILARAQWMAGDAAGALVTARRVSETTASNRLAPLTSWSQAVVALALRDLGDVDGARAAAEQCLAVSRATPQPRGEGVALAVLSWAARLQGDVAAALRLASEGVEVLANTPTLRPLGHAGLVEARLAAGDAAGALADARRGIEALERLPYVDDGELELRWALVRALQATGDGRGAAAALALAQRRLDAKTWHLTPEHRERYLALPVNAAIAAAAP